MIGGNLKCVLTKGIALSMPSVVDGNDYSLRVCGARTSHRLSFQCEEGPFWIIVLTGGSGAPGLSRALANGQGNPAPPGDLRV